MARSLFERIFEPDATPTDSAPSPSAILPRVALCAAAVATYCGLIVLEFSQRSEPGAAAEDDPVSTAGFLLFIAANVLMVRTGHIVVSAIACVTSWTVVYQLRVAEVPPWADEGFNPSVAAPIVIGIVNFIVLLAGHMMIEFSSSRATKT